MILSEKEIMAIKNCLARIEKKDRVGMNKYYATNQLRTIRQILTRAERREKNILI